MSTRRRVQLARPHVHRAAVLSLVCFVLYIGAGFAVADGLAFDPVLQAIPYLFVGIVVRTTVRSGMPYRQFQFALVLLLSLYLGMGVVALQQYLVSDLTAARAFLVLLPLDAVGLYLTARGWVAGRSA